MRHDPASGAIIVSLRSLKMHGMAQAITDLMDQRDRRSKRLSSVRAELAGNDKPVQPNEICISCLKTVIRASLRNLQLVAIKM